MYSRKKIIRSPSTVITSVKATLKEDESSLGMQGDPLSGINECTSPTQEHEWETMACENGPLIHYFLVFSVLTKAGEVSSLGADFKLETGISARFPCKDHPNFPVQNGWTHFAFPSGIVVKKYTSPPRVHFAVLTNMYGTKSFGTFLQFDEDWGKDTYVTRVLCLISRFPQFHILKRAIFQIYKLSSKYRPEAFIESLLQVPAPSPGEYAVKFNLSQLAFYCKLPRLRDPLSSRIPLRVLFDLIGVDTILGVFSAILAERRILFHSHALSSLTIVPHCFLQILHPFKWHYAFIPVVPESMLDVYQLPQPFILGVHSKYLRSMDDLGDIVLVDLDHNVLRSSDPLPALPQGAGGTLWAAIQDVYELNASQRDYCLDDLDPLDPDICLESCIDHNVYSAFLQYYSEVFGGFDRYVYFIEDVPILNKKGFLRSRGWGQIVDDGMESFCAMVVSSRMFEQLLSAPLSDPYITYIAKPSSEILDQIFKEEAEPIALMTAPTMTRRILRNSDTATTFPKSLKSEDISVTLYQTKLTEPEDDRCLDIILRSSGSHETRLKQLLMKLFSSDAVTTREFDAVVKSLKKKSARRNLALILNYQRSSHLCLSKHAFRSFRRLIMAALDSSLHNEDYTLPVAVYKMCDVVHCIYSKQNSSSDSVSMSRSFSPQSGGNRRKERTKIYLFAVLKDHLVWKSETFWRVAIESAVGSQLNSQSIANQWLIDATYKMSQQLELERTFINSTIYCLGNLYALHSDDFMMLSQLVDNLKDVDKDEASGTYG